MDNLPPLKTLPVFEAVARARSFSRAAAQLHVTQSAVSHRIRQLEDFLGETLLLRRGRTVELTAEGRRYLEEISSGLDQIRQATGALQGRASTAIRLAAPSSFAVRWLIPRLPDLQRQHPEIEVMLEMLDEAPDLSDRLADAFITLQPRQRGFSTDLLYEERIFPICSRQYRETVHQQLRQRGLIGEEPPDRLQPDWLHGHPLLSSSSITGRAGEDWTDWFAAQGSSVPASSRMQHFSHMLMAHAAARHHQGIALTNDYMMQPDDDPDLVPLHAGMHRTGDRFFFACKTSRRREPGLRALWHWIVGQAVRSGLRARADRTRQDTFAR
ncbi:LysR substrate-binding domain-containing protein [Methylonatrum kenyense]|uniref:LysR family transcriptional regulator n=1 Tax=Methylonatrum kenyense TaxID=455253 RepID=UPI0020C0550B|nr:LysR family transcriptional regulator [Methylonatrum kenyense]MCK8514770.1 LysR substrate-binding domain-containing protein [Methylonatrum kenyense]